MSKGQGKRIKRAIEEVGLDATLTLVEWVHRPGSWWVDHKRTSIETIFCWGDSPFAGYERKNTFPSMVEEALTWKPDGQATPAHRVNGVSPSAAWSHVLQVMRARGWKMPVEPIHQNPDVDRAMRGALDKIGGARAIGQSTEYSIAGIASQFQSEFARMYHV